MNQLSTTCAIAGGGPAGMMLGYLLARAGVDVTVLEKHGDFLRDFRGDTVHPSTLRVMDELGLLEKFLKLPHAKIRAGSIELAGRRYQLGDFSRLPEPYNFIALMPQWDFLDFLKNEAARFPHFHLLMRTEAKDLLAQGDRIVGMLASGAAGEDGRKVNLDIRAGLTVAADGRHSVLRAKSGLPLEELGAPFDVLWLRLPFCPGDPVDLVGRLAPGQFFVMIYRGDYWQCAYGIAKGGFEAIRAKGIDAFRAQLKQIAGFAADRIDAAIPDFEQVRLLTVTVNRLKRWARPGFLCIGDAAHAMSPVGGVGINLAIQDAVATANILGPVLKKGVPRFSALQKVQARRQWPTKLIQGMQIGAQNLFLAPTLSANAPLKAPLLLKLFDRSPWLRQFPARFIGFGPRPEHVTFR
jgi:2-polyprenyl-6-methoxyphenol hydroxylase-like FAD-dependent oxidoreductase